MDGTEPLALSSGGEDRCGDFGSETTSTLQISDDEVERSSSQIGVFTTDDQAIVRCSSADPQEYKKQGLRKLPPSPHAEGHRSPHAEGHRSPHTEGHRSPHTEGRRLPHPQQFQQGQQHESQPPADFRSVLKKGSAPSRPPRSEQVQPATSASEIDFKSHLRKVSSPSHDSIKRSEEYTAELDLRKNLRKASVTDRPERDSLAPPAVEQQDVNFRKHLRKVNTPERRAEPPPETQGQTDFRSLLKKKTNVADDVNAIVGKLEKEQGDPTGFLRTELAVRRWIETVLHVKLNEGPLIDDLKDGTYICQLMSKINERAIPHMHVHTKIAFKQKENIIMFIGACEELGISSLNRFVLNDLFLKQSPLRVVNCLQELSVHAVKRSQDGLCDPIPPLPEVNPEEISFKQEEIKEAEEVLQSIASKVHRRQMRRTNMANRVTDDVRTEAVEQRADDDTIPPAPQGDAPVMPKKKEQPTFSSVPPTSAAPIAFPTMAATPLEFSRLPVSSNFLQRASKVPPRVHHGVALFQAIIRGNKARTAFFQKVRHNAYRDRVAKEILTTEEAYMKNLRLYLDKFVYPIQEKKLVNKDFLDHLRYHDIEVIINYTNALLQKLRPRVENWTPSQCLGDIFVQIAGFLKAYTQYVNTYSSTVVLISQEKASNAKFAEFLKGVEYSEAVYGLDMTAYLILPVQRIPRYELLMRELVEHTEAEHRDYANLRKAYDQMKEVANYVNGKKREFDNILKTRDVHQRFQSTQRVFPPSRRYMDEMNVISSPDRKDLIVYIFNDVVMITKLGGMLSTISKSVRPTGDIRQWAKVERPLKIIHQCPVSEVRMVQDAPGGPVAMKVGKKSLTFLADQGDLARCQEALAAAVKEEQALPSDTRERIRAQSDLSLAPSSLPSHARSSSLTPSPRHSSSERHGRSATKSDAHTPSSASPSPDAAKLKRKKSLFGMISSKLNQKSEG